MTNATTFRIVKTYLGTDNGGMRVAWNVIDANDVGFDVYVYDTFDLKRDAKAWIERALAAA